MRHCPSVCHTHPLQTFVGQRSGSFTTPGHEYPSHLLLTVTVTDSGGLRDTETVQLNPKSVALAFVTSPGGGTLTVAGGSHTATHGQTFIVGSRFNVTAPASRVVDGVTYAFASWSDGGGRTHAVTAPATGRTYRASYVPVRKRLVVATRPGGMAFEVDGKRRAPGWERAYPVGSVVRVGAFLRLRHDGDLFRFVRWSDGGGRHHQVTIPNRKHRLAAVYRRIG